MNAKKLEKSIALYNQIKTLDAEIIEIDKFAMLVANGEIKSSFDLKIEDVGKQKEEDEKVKFDEDGSLISSNNPAYDVASWIRKSIEDQHRMFRFAFDTGTQQSKHVHSMKVELTENATMQILGVLLCEKQAKRASMVKQLELMGVNM